MAIQVLNDWARPVAIGTWPLPGEPHFAKSRAYRIFLRELRRYTIEEVSGRSFLIAGHRGAGKTALVNQAVRELRNRLLQESINSDTTTIGRRVRLQRPLIVKLVGTSLLAPVPAKQTNDESNGTAAVAGNGECDIPKPPKASASDEVANALVHITIALYRALAAEVAQAFAIHAREQEDGTRAERQELAAQFALDLDNAPEPALLRRHWNQLGRLAEGVLWPRLADGTLKANAITDQGLREIVAVATAAQAFQVCSGNVTWKLTAGETAARSAEIAAKLDVKDLVSRLGSILAGTVAGGAAAVSNSGAITSVGVALLVWLAGSAVLGWSGTRTRKTNQSLDYTFLRDRSIQTLDRDLPLVIERIRAAGLAPVFVIDELDKLQTPGTTISSILDRLKHLMSDYGFFCFLTDRGYYDEVERIVATETYPTVHTYFSERLLVINGSAELFQYITGMLMSDAPGESDNVPIATFALATIFRSKMNFTDLTREITHATGDEGALLVTADDLRTRNDLRLAAAIQLSCDEALRGERYATRFGNDPTFAQLAIDALYYIPRSWEEPTSDCVDLSDEAIAAYLIDRSEGRSYHSRSNRVSETEFSFKSELLVASNASEPNDSDLTDDDTYVTDEVFSADNLPPSAEKPKASTGNPEKPARISSTDLRMAIELVWRQTSFLIDFTALAKAVRDRPGTDPWRLVDIIPLELGVQGLIRASNDAKAYQYRFLLDETGLPLESMEKAEWLNSERQAQVAGMIELFVSFNALMAQTGLTADALIGVGLLPASLSTVLLSDARLALDNAGLARVETEALKRGLTSARQLARALSDASRTIPAWLIILQEVRRRAGSAAGTVAESLSAIGRYLVASASSDTSTELRSTAERLGSSIAGILDFGDLGRPENLDALRSKLVGLEPSGKEATPLSPIQVSDLWIAWRNRLLGWFEEGRHLIADIMIEDLVSAVSRTMPGSVFKFDLTTMDIRDWSRLALASLSRSRRTEAPAWSLIAAMRALGFDGNKLRALVVQMPKAMSAPMSSADDEAMRRMATGVGEHPAGLLVLAPVEMSTILVMETGKGRPMIIVAEDAFPDYEEALNILASQGAFEGVIDAIG